jgi:hypothetical protein
MWTRGSGRVLLAFTLLFGFCARAATYKSPLLDHHAWRQADTASIARNFYRERFNILYPQIDQRGSAQAGYVETGLELFAFAAASVALVTGFHPEIGRLLSALLFVCSDVLVWMFVGRRYGRAAGLGAAFLYAFGFPLMLFMERAFMNEALLVCLSLVCLVAAQRHVATRRAAPAAVLVIASALLAAIKLPYLIVWAPVLGLFLEADGRRAWKNAPLWLMALVDLAVAIAWYRHAHQLGQATGFSFGLTDKLFDARTAFSAEFSWTMMRRLFKDVLGPVGCIGGAAGLWYAARERRWTELLGIGGFVAYLLLVTLGNYVHDYYQLAIIPIAPSLVALGLTRLGALIPARRRRRALFAAAMGIAVFASFARSVSAHSWYEYSEDEAALCRRVAALSEPAERVVVVGTADPRFLFCIDRKGWLFPVVDSDDAHIRRAWSEGARIAVVPSSLEGAGVDAFLEQHGTPLASSAEQRVFRLNR